MRASRTKRAIFRGLAAGSRSSAMATWRSVERSKVRRTDFIPPLPSSSPTRYFSEGELSISRRAGKEASSPGSLDLLAE